MTIRLSDRNSAVNHQINRLDQKFTEFVILNSDTLSTFSGTDIKNYVLGIGKSDTQTASKFIDEYFEKAVTNNVNRTPGTIKNYRRAINHFNSFLAARNQKSVLVSQVDFELASAFKNYLVNSNLQLNRVGMTEVSASGVIKKFRTIFSEAVDRELLKRNPFKTVKIKTKSPRKERLTIEQVAKIYFLNKDLYPFLELYRDIFLFSVYTGLSNSDSMGLSWSNLECRNDGSYKLTIFRQKSDVTTECFLPQHAANIALKYKTIPEYMGSGKILPRRSNKEVNERLKMIAQLSGIPFRLSTHTARHTFRQLLAEAEVTDYGVIKRLMGQSRNGDVDEVYYAVTEKGLMDAKVKIQSLLDEHFVKQNTI